MSEDIYAKFKKMDIESLKKFEKHKKLFEAYEKRKIKWEDLLVHFTDWELVHLSNKNKFKEIKTPEQLKSEREAEAELARVKRLDSSLSPSDLLVRQEFKSYHFEPEPLSRSVRDKDQLVILDWEVSYDNDLLKKLKKYPIGLAKRVLTPKEFKLIKETVYG
ncbi:MAG: hypothetical protein WC307_04120 [Candidatus Nanoarchaeia archaeon]